MLIGEGLARGCSSTEADVWLKNGKLYVSIASHILRDMFTD